MSHFYGTVQGNRGEATRCGHKSSGLTTEAAGWHGCIKTHVYYDEETNTDKFEVALVPWQGSGGWSRVVTSGILNANEHRYGDPKQVVRIAMDHIGLVLKSLERYNDTNHS